MTIALVGITSVQVGRSIALLLAGAGWWWPPSAALVPSSWSVLTGDALAGLHFADDVPPTPQWLVWGCAAAIFLGLIIIASWGMFRWMAASRHKGMASATEAHRLLGLSRLRAHRTIIRPDLYRKNHR